MSDSTGTVRIQYDSQTQRVYVSRRTDARVCDSVLISLNPLISVDYDAEGRVYGVEISEL
jgi:uncharacterized protein YuzE